VKKYQAAEFKTDTSDIAPKFTFMLQFSLFLKVELSSDYTNCPHLFNRYRCMAYMEV